MVRPLRLLVENGMYHVTTLGIERRAIFLNDIDRNEFMSLLDRTIARFGWRCLTYCLMDTHVHLLLETPQPNLSRGMQQLKSSYAHGFNTRHRREGPLFVGRFKAKLIQKDAHLLEVFRYIALNPVHAGMCFEPLQWKWSGHAAIAGEVPPPRFLALEEARKWFSSPVDGDGATTYRAFVGVTEPVLDEERRIAVGDADFLRSVLPSTSPGAEFSRRDWGEGRPPLSELLAQGDSGAVIVRAYREHGYTLSSLASALGCHVSTVSRRLRAHEARDA